MIGIVMPTYNQSRYIDSAVRSVLEQTHTDWRMVIVDDGSTDGTDVVRFLCDQVTPSRSSKNQGTAHAINCGVRILPASCDWLTWVSSDNVMSPVWLSALLARAEPDVGALYGGFHYCHPPRGPVRYIFQEHDIGKLIRQPHNCYYGPAFLIRRDVWLEAGEHRGAISHDYDHWLRVEEVCFRRGLVIEGVDQSLCRYLAHDERATVVRASEYDAHLWQAVALERRGSNEQLEGSPPCS